MDKNYGHLGRRTELMLRMCERLVAIIATGILAFVLLSIMPRVGSTSADTNYQGASTTNPRDSVTIQRIKVTESYIGDNTGVIALADANTSETIYAYDIRSDWPKTGDTYILQGEADAGLTYLINHSFPVAAVTNRDDIDQYITQLAIWRYLSLREKSSTVSSSYQEGSEAYKDIRDIAENLAKEAVEANEWGYAAAGYEYKKVYIYTREDDPIDRLLLPLE